MEKEHRELRSSDKSHASSHEEYHKGDHVRYHPATSTGIVQDIMTEDGTMRHGRRSAHVHATHDEPLYVIENDNTHKRSVVKPESIESKTK
ncbi:hypothetical protein RI367_001905 [Sorochytrium milnesiophthora]